MNEKNEMKQDYPEFLDIQGLSELLRCKKSCLYKRIHAGNLGFPMYEVWCGKRKRKLLFKRREILDCLENRRIDPAGKNAVNKG